MECKWWGSENSDVIQDVYVNLNFRSPLAINTRIEFAVVIELITGSLK